ncbi:MAG: hypothetical protein ACTFAL_14815 [Candidatus Electronema sp. V4]|uniref:hypothetical protein n=1 Tax=Candidatus Electronema sp. V4 TaxID=3454756 RepID=UPI004055435C
MTAVGADLRVAAWRVGVLLAAGCMALFSGCSSEPPPFAAEYISQNRVLVTYQGRQHVLNRYGSSAPVPFKYRFEEDGDLDLLIDGRTYEVDSPYDRDVSKKKKKKAAKQPSGAASRQR